MTAMRIGLGLVLGLAALAAIAFQGVVGARGQAAAITIEGGVVEAAPGSVLTFGVSGAAPVHTIGAFSITVEFDPGVVRALSCQSSVSRCNKGAGEGQVILNGIRLSGWTGNIAFGTIVFEATGAVGSRTPVDLSVTSISDVAGDKLDLLTAVKDGSVSIRATGPDHPLGDADCDSELGPGDSLAIMERLAGLGESACLGLGDLNCDDQVDALDTLDILRVAGGLDIDLPAGCPHPD